MFLSAPYMKREGKFCFGSWFQRIFISTRKQREKQTNKQEMDMNKAALSACLYWHPSSVYAQSPDISRNSENNLQPGDQELESNYLSLFGTS